MIILVILFLFAIGILTNILNSKYQQETLKYAYAKIRCDRHTWTYNNNDKLQCTECGKIAGVNYEKIDEL